jgi:transposase
MVQSLQVRELREEERQTLQKWIKARNIPRWQGERAEMIWWVSQQKSAAYVGRLLHVESETVSRWVHRFNERGLAGLLNEPRSGRPPIYTVDEVSVVINTAVTDPKSLGLPFGSWTLDRLQSYLEEEKQIGMKRSRLDEILLKEGLRWRQEERWFGVRVDPDFAKKRGPLSSSTRGRRPRASSSV